MAKDVWPLTGQNVPDNTQEQGTILLIATKSLLAKVKNKENPPIEVIKSWLRAVIDYLERTTNFPTHDVVLGAIDKLTAQVGRNHEMI